MSSSQQMMLRNFAVDHTLSTVDPESEIPIPFEILHPFSNYEGRGLGMPRILWYLMNLKVGPRLNVFPSRLSSSNNSVCFQQ